MPTFWACVAAYPAANMPPSATGQLGIFTAGASKSCGRQELASNPRQGRSCDERLQSHEAQLSLVTLRCQGKNSSLRLWLVWVVGETFQVVAVCFEGQFSSGVTSRYCKLLKQKCQRVSV